MPLIDTERPYLLAIETSGFYGSVGLGRVNTDGEPEIIGTVKLSRNERSARSLAPAINDLLNRHELKPKQLGAVAVTSGPGSFTGLRVGLTTAKTMAYVIDAKVFGINTLACLAHQSKDSENTTWCLIDAQRKEWFAWKKESTSKEITTSRLTHAELCKSLSEGNRIVGPEVNKLATRLGEESARYQWREENVCCESLTKLGIQRWIAGEPDDLFQLVPEYHRPSAAEENFDRQQAKR